MSDEDKTKDIRNAIAKAWMDFNDDVGAICAANAREDLYKVVEVYEKEAADPSSPVQDLHKMFAETVLAEIGVSIAYERAREVLAVEGSSGVYCVYHDCDMKQCPPGSHD